MECKLNRNRKARRKRRTRRKRRLTVNKWDVYVSQMEGEELNEVVYTWCDNRSGWVNDRVR